MDTSLLVEVLLAVVFAGSATVTVFLIVELAKSWKKSGSREFEEPEVSFYLHPKDILRTRGGHYPVRLRAVGRSEFELVANAKALEVKKFPGGHWVAEELLLTDSEISVSGDGADVEIKGDIYLVRGVFIPGAEAKRVAALVTGGIVLLLVGVWVFVIALASLVAEV